MEYRKINELCKPMVKNIKQKDLSDNKSLYPVYGASGLAGYTDTYAHDKEYVGVVKDGSGVGRTNIYPAKSSLLGTMQHILPNDNVNCRYLMYAISHLKLGDTFSGAAIPHIYFKDYGKLLIKYVTLEKQIDISNKLHTIESAITHKNELLNELDDLIKSRFIEMFGDKFDNANEHCKIKDICTATIGLTYKPENVSHEGTIVLRSGNIQNNALQVENDIVRVVNTNISEEKLIKPNDILMCSRNGSARLVGKSCLITSINEPMSFGAFMTVVRCSYPYFMQAFFTSDYFRQQLTGTKTASVNQITTKMLYEYTTIKPSKQEENEFAEFVKLIDKSKFIVQKQIDDLQELLDSKMDEYFG